MDDSCDRGLCSGEGVVPSEGVEDAGDEEVRVPTTQQRPIAPTKAELKEHYPLHLNYRSWCPYCVSGKGHSKHHRRSDDEPVEKRDGFTTWHMDYCFFGKKSFEEEEEESENIFTLLVVYDDNLDAFWALRVDKKGASKEVVKWCCDKLEDSGYS